MDKIISDAKTLCKDTYDGLKHLCKKVWNFAIVAIRQTSITITVKTPFIDFSFAPSFFLLPHI